MRITYDAECSLLRLRLEVRDERGSLVKVETTDFSERTVTTEYPDGRTEIHALE